MSRNNVRIAKRASRTVPSSELPNTSFFGIINEKFVFDSIAAVVWQSVFHSASYVCRSTYRNLCVYGQRVLCSHLVISFISYSYIFVLWLWGGCVCSYVVPGSVCCCGAGASSSL